MHVHEIGTICSTCITVAGVVAFYAAILLINFKRKKVIDTN